MVLALTLVRGAAVWAQTAEGVHGPLTLHALERLVLPVPPNVIHLESADPSIVELSQVSPGLAVVRGVRPGRTALLMLTPDALLLRPVVVRSALLAGGGGGAGSAALTLTYMPTSSALQAELHGDGLDVLVAPGGWTAQARVGSWLLGAGSALPTPLLPFGAPEGSGITGRSADGYEVAVTHATVEVGKHLAVPHGDLLVAGTTMGPLLAVHTTWAPVTVDMAALASTSGGVQAAGALSTTLGPATVGYTISPKGGGVQVQYRTGSTVLGFGAGPSGSQVGVTSGLAGGSGISAWWDLRNTYQLTVTTPPIHGSTPVSVTVTPNSVFLLATIGPAPSPLAAAPLGQGVLTLIPSAAAPWARPVPPPLPGMITVSSAFPAVLAGMALPADPAVPSQVQMHLPVSVSPTASPSVPSDQRLLPERTALLVVQACLVPPSRGTCEASDPAVPVTITLDGVPMPLTDAAIPVSPEDHEVRIDPANVPPLLTPSGPLSCRVHPTLETPSSCTFAFHRPGGLLP